MSNKELSPITTVRLGDHLPLLEILPDSNPLAWVRGGEGLVGWGVYATKTVTGPHRFAEARAWWEKQLENFVVTNSVHGSGTGPVLFASFSFSANDESVLVIPNIVVGSKKDKSWITWIGLGQQPILNSSPDFVQNAQLKWSNHSDSVSESVSESKAESEWKEKVSTAVHRIKDGSLAKVVLARDLTFRSEKDIDPRPILHKLASEYPTTWTYCVDRFVGATPELLLRLSRGMLTSRVLAGTISKTGDDSKDLALAASLARSSKDLAEHEYAVRSVAEAIEPFCTSINVPDSPFVLHLANVMHLATDVTGAIAETLAHVDAFTILEQLHPSAAVCGTPRAVAAELITEIEGMSRGRYAGPIGWIDAAGDGELGIALRGGEIKGNTIRIFAGCGIVEESDPEVELAETNAKFTPMRGALLDSVS